VVCLTKMPEQTKSTYDQIFDFLFNIQRTKKALNVKKDPRHGDLGNALLEIGLQPAIYPVDVTLDEIKKTIEKGSEIQMGNEGKFATTPFTPPSEISKAIKKERSKRDSNRTLALWSSIGGNLDANSDAALLSMLAKKFDLSGEEAIEMANLYKNIKKEENKLIRDKAMWGKDFLPSKVDKDFPDLDIDFLGDEYKKEREKYKNNILEKGQKILLDTVIKDLEREKKEIAKQTEEKKWEQTTPQVIEWLDEPQIITPEKKEEEIQKEDILNIIKDPNINLDQEREEKLQSLFIQKGADDKHAQLYAKYILKENSNIWNDKNYNYLQPSLDSLYKSLAFRIVSEELKQKKVNINNVEAEVFRVENELRAFINNNKSNYGVKFQRALLLKRFLDSSKSFNAIFLSGEWEKFETQGLAFSQVVKKKLVKDEQGNIIGEYFDKGDSVIGKLLGRAYYLHPKNFLNGILNNGELWLKLACGEDGKLNKKSFAYAMYNITPGRLIKKGLNQFAKPFNSVSEALRNKVLNPFFSKIMGFTKKFLKNFLGATGIGGFIASRVITLFEDKIEYYIIQIVQVFLISILGIIFAIIFSIGGTADKQYASTMENTYKEASPGNSFTDYDWESSKE